METVRDEFSRSQSKPTWAPVEPEAPSSPQLSDEEEGLLLNLLAFPDQHCLLERLCPPEQIVSPLARSLAQRIISGGSELEPIRVEDRAEKSLLIDLQERLPSMGKMEYPLELVTDLLIQVLSRQERNFEDNVGASDDEAIRRSLEIKKLKLEIDQKRRDVTIPELEEILDRFQEPAALREE